MVTSSISFSSKFQNSNQFYIQFFINSLKNLAADKVDGNEID